MNIYLLSMQDEHTIPIQELFERLQVDPSYVSVDTKVVLHANIMQLGKTVCPFPPSLLWRWEPLISAHHTHGMPADKCMLLGL